MSNPDISIVVCTHNRAAMLRDALASLYDLATEGEFSYEIVVIDNGSTDDTPQVIAQAAEASKHPLRGIYEPEPGVVAARNRGIREARGQWVAFFDDDQLADWHWLAELYRGAIERNCRVVGGAVQLALPAGCQRKLSSAARMLLGEAQAGDEPQRYGGRLTPGCGNLMLQRTVFDKVGVFETAIDGRGEDTDLFERIQRARIEAWYFPTAVIHHLTPPERLERDYLLSQAVRMGRGMAQRRRRALGWARFSLLWLASAAKIVALEYPRLMRAGMRKDHEETLGRRLQLTISQAFLSGACGSKAAAVSVKTPAAAAPASFALAGCEPTAAMKLPAYSIAATSPTLPFDR